MQLYFDHLLYNHVCLLKDRRRLQIENEKHTETQATATQTWDSH